MNTLFSLVQRSLPLHYDLSLESISFDFSQTVSNAAIAGMITAIVISLLLPVLLFIYAKRRTRIHPLALIVSMCSYLFGSYLLPNLTILGLRTLFPAMIDTTPYYMLLAVIISVFDLLALTAGLHLYRKFAPLNLAAALIFALFFNIMPLLIQNLSNLTYYISISLTINQGGLSDAAAAMIEAGSTEEEIQSMLDAMSFLFTKGFGFYLLLALDTLLMLPIHTGICAVLSGKIEKQLPKKPAYSVYLITLFYASALLIRYIGLSDHLFFAELLYLMVGLLSLMLAFLLYRTYAPKALKKFFSKPEPSPEKKAKEAEKKHKMPKIVMPKD